MSPCESPALGVCEVCGEPATIETINERELPPERDARTGDLWARWEPCGEVRHLCFSHRHQKTVSYRPERSAESVAEMEQHRLRYEYQDQDQD